MCDNVNYGVCVCLVGVLGWLGKGVRGEEIRSVPQWTGLPLLLLGLQVRGEMHAGIGLKSSFANIRSRL